MQDNSPIHNCRVVKEWFAHHPHITLLALDLNPIEYVWAAMVRDMPSQERRQSRITVVNSALQAWERLRGQGGQDLAANLVASMPNRLNEVLDVGGAYTHY